MKLLSNRGFCNVFPKSVDDMCYQWLKASNRISNDSFFSHALFEILGFTGMTSFLMTLPLTSKSISSWCAKVLLYG
jgi:hypothetical protein